MDHDVERELRALDQSIEMLLKERDEATRLLRIAVAANRGIAESDHPDTIATICRNALLDIGDRA